MKTGVPVSPSVCKFTKDVGRSGREENPGNDLQTISYIFRKLYPGCAVAVIYRHSGPDRESLLTRYQRRMKGRYRRGRGGSGRYGKREKADAGSVKEPLKVREEGEGGAGSVKEPLEVREEGEGRCQPGSGEC